MNYEVRWTFLYVFSLAKKIPKGDMIAVFKYVKDGYKEDGDQLFAIPTKSRTRNNWLNFQQERFRLDMRKKEINFLII